MSRTHEELRDIGAAVAKMFGAYPGMFVSEGATEALLEYLDEFPASVTVQALRLTPLFVPNRYPNAPEVREVAQLLRRYGYTACRYASRNWRDGSMVDRAALVGDALRQQVKTAFDRVGNPELPAPAALLPEEAGHAPRSEKSEQQARRAQELMAAGLPEHKAWCTAALEMIDATPIVNRSIPSRKRRGSA